MLTAQCRDPVRYCLSAGVHTGRCCSRYPNVRTAHIARRHPKTPPEGAAEMRVAGETVAEGDLADGPPAGHVRREQRAAAVETASEDIGRHPVLILEQAVQRRPRHAELPPQALR